MKRILTAIIPLALLGACQTVPAPVAAPASAPTETVTEADTVETVETTEAAAETTEATTDAATVVKKRTYIIYENSALISSLVSESVMNDDVALMGLLSGARNYCGLDWQPGFVAFLNLANQNKLNLERVADDHGYYMGAAKRALTDAEHECSDTDLIELRKIEPY